MKHEAEVKEGPFVAVTSNLSALDAFLSKGARPVAVQVLSLSLSLSLTHTHTHTQHVHTHTHLYRHHSSWQPGSSNEALLPQQAK